MLVHGLGGTRAAIWKHLAPELEGDFTVVSYDLRGTGGSARPPGPYSLDDFVADLRGLVQELGLERPSLVGHSFGGSIVLAYAARFPHEVAALAVLGGPVALPEQARQGLRDRADTVEAQGMLPVAEAVATNGMASAFREARPDELARYAELLATSDPAAYAATCRAIAGLDLRGELQAIEAPVLLLAGDLDGVAPPAAQAETEAALGDAVRIMVPETGHILPWEQPEVVRDAVSSFLHARAASPA